MKLDGSGAAGDALAARFFHAKLHEKPGKVDHVGVLIHDDHAARAHHRAELGEGLVVDGRVEKFGRDAPAGRTSGLHGFDRAFARSASELLNDLAEGHAHRNLDQPGPANRARQGEDLGSLAFRGADRGEPIAAFLDDRRHVGEGFDVVDQGRQIPEPGFGRVGGPGARYAPLALDRMQERGFLTADVCPGTNANIEPEVKPRFRRSGCPGYPGFALA